MKTTEIIKEKHYKLGFSGGVWAGCLALQIFMLIMLATGATMPLWVTFLPTILPVTFCVALPLFICAAILLGAIIFLVGIGSLLLLLFAGIIIGLLLLAPFMLVMRLKERSSEESEEITFSED